MTKTAIVVMIGYCLLAGYSAWEIRYWLRERKKYLAPTLVLFFLFALLPFGGDFLPESSWKNEMAALGNIWFGFLLIFCGTLFLAHVIRLIVGRFDREIGRTGCLIVLSLCLLVSVGLNGYGMATARNVVRTDYTVNLSENSQEEKTLTVALLSDLHLGSNSHLSQIEKMVEMTNEAEPDVVLIAGDIFSSSYAQLKNPSEYIHTLQKLTARYGIYAVWGNHDVDEKLFAGFSVSPVAEAKRSPEMEVFMEEAGITVLEDEMVSFGGVQLVGRKDERKPGDGTTTRLDVETLMENVDPTKPVFVMEHEPTDYQTLAERGADLVLSGHTHDGQIFPGNLILRKLNENSYGKKELYGVNTLVSSGVGFYGPPLRIGTKSEIVVVQVTY